MTVVDCDAFVGEAKPHVLMAHLDFVMVDAHTSEPRFAVELDGALHWHDPVGRRRDQIRTTCAAEPASRYLRITADFT